MEISLFSLRHFLKRPIFIDLILAILVIISFILSNWFSGMRCEYDYGSFFLNLTTSLISVWITVRLIDNLINKRERLRNARIMLFEDLSHPFHFLEKHFEILNENDLRRLKRDIELLEKKWKYSIHNNSIFKPNEEDIARNLYNLNMQISMDVHNVIVSKNMNNPTMIEQDKELLRKRLDTLRKSMSKMETEIGKLRVEMWKTTSPIQL